MDNIKKKIESFLADQKEKTRKRLKPTREEKREAIAKQKKNNPGDDYYNRLEKQYEEKWAKEDEKELKEPTRFKNIRRKLAGTKDNK